MDLSQVTLAQMRYAVAVGELLNFRHAAESVHVSQSGLSMQVQKLEDLLGATLFDRGKKPVLITEVGQSILAQMRVILRETERLTGLAADDDRPAGRYRLGVIPTLSSSLIPLFLGKFLKTYPDVELVIEELKTEEMVNRLHSDTLDGGLAATPLNVPGFQEQQLGLETMFAYLPPTDPLLKRKSIAQTDLLGRKIWVMPEGHCFRSQVLSYCELANKLSVPNAHNGKQVRAIFESGNFETLIRLVDAGLGATVLPALIAARIPRSHSKQIVGLNSPVPVREIGLVTARSALRRSVSDALTKMLRRELANSLPPVPRRSQVLDPLAGESK